MSRIMTANWKAPCVITNTHILSNGSRRDGSRGWRMGGEQGPGDNAGEKARWGKF